MTPCRDTLGSLRCNLAGGHSGPHRSGAVGSGMILWAQRMPEWVQRARAHRLPAKAWA